MLLLIMSIYPQCAYPPQITTVTVKFEFMEVSVCTSSLSVMVPLSTLP